MPQHRQVPAAGAVGGGHHFLYRGRGAQPLAPPECFDRGGGLVAQPCRTLVARPPGQFADPHHRGVEGGVVQPVDQVGGPSRCRGVL